MVLLFGIWLGGFILMAGQMLTDDFEYEIEGGGPHEDLLSAAIWPYWLFLMLRDNHGK